MSMKRTTKKPIRRTVPLTMDAELEAKVSAAASKTSLSKQAVMRMSIDRGLEILLTQLSGSSAA